MFRSLRELAEAYAPTASRARRLVAHCRQLLTERGEAAGVSLARLTLDLYRELNKSEQAQFFSVLLADFSPNPSDVLAASQAYAKEASAANLAKVCVAAEPPRQELLRRLNRAPGGTATILRMRERLLELKRDTRELDAVDWDFRHLLSSWFNPGFLRIVRLDWHTPAYLLEQIISHEAVHEIRGWDDLRRRLSADRRCFAFFHPALPDEPLIFVEVALMDRMADRVSPLVDSQPGSKNPDRARVAVFYSINNCQPGLRGVSLGNFLIKNVVELLSTEFPRIKLFCTLSPVPGFAAWVDTLLKGGDNQATKTLALASKAMNAGLGAQTANIAGDAEHAVPRLEPLKDTLMQLCAKYLLHHGDGADPGRDPVARFHLNNGARLERINWLADVSKKGLRESLGLMVNYLYDPRSIEDNHEKFVHGEIVASRRVLALNRND